MESFKPGKPLWSSFFKHFLHNAAAIFQYSIFVQNVGATIFSGGCQWLACLRWLGQQGVSCGLCRIKWWFNWINLNKLRICQKLHLISDMWLQSRTSNSVDRAGLSLRPAPWREPTSRFSSNIMSFGALNHPHNKFPLLTIYHLWRNPTSNCSSNILSSSSLGLFKTHISNKSPLLTIYGRSSLQHSHIMSSAICRPYEPLLSERVVDKGKNNVDIAMVHRRRESWSPSPSRTWWTAAGPREIWAAMEDSWTRWYKYKCWYKYKYKYKENCLSRVNKYKPLFRLSTTQLSTRESTLKLPTNTRWETLFSI